MKHINIVIIDGVEKDMATLTAEERLEYVKKLNSIAVGYLGYQEKGTVTAEKSLKSYTYHFTSVI